MRIIKSNNDTYPARGIVLSFANIFTHNCTIIEKIIAPIKNITKGFNEKRGVIAMNKNKSPSPK